MTALIKKLFIMLLATLTVSVPQIGDFVESHRPIPEDFRVTTYVVADTVLDEKNVHPEDFDIITDVILFGCVRFDERGNLDINEDVMITALKNLRNAIGKRDVSITVNLLGPAYNGPSEDWYDQMTKQGRLHNKAFLSPRLQKNIVNLLKDYSFDGVHFDYEYPIDKTNWFFFNQFLTALDKKIGDKTLGVAISDWDMHLNAKAIDAVDHIELMLYDLYDEDGRHAPTDRCIELSKKISDVGIARNKVDFGIPFYSRPTDGAGYWYEYKSYADKLDKDGFFYDEKIDKTFWFNTPDVIEEKTIYAKKGGFGGVMVWHYACDLPSSDSRSVLRAVNSGVFKAQDKLPFTGIDYTIPQIDLSVMPEEIRNTDLAYLYNLTTVDASKDYLAHPDSVLLKNGNILTLYPEGHGKGPVLNRISTDGGLSWNSQLKNTPESWKNSKETPTVYRLQFSDGKADKLIMISANPKWWDEETTEGGFNCSISCDEGETWTEFQKFYGLDQEDSVIPIVAMSSLTRLKENGKFVDKWMGTFHDAEFFNYKTILTFDENGNMHWSKPEKYFSAYREIEKKANMCEVEIIRSDKGKGDELCLIARSNSKKMNSLISFSFDEGKTWSAPVEAPAALNGERHKAEYTKDGRLFITFRSIERGQKAQRHAKSVTNGGWISEGWVAWVGTYEDLKSGSEGQYRIKLAHVYADETFQQRPEYYAGSDTGYSANVVLPDGTIVTSSYGKFSPTEKTSNRFSPSRKTYIASKRIKLEDIDRLYEILSDK